MKRGEAEDRKSSYNLKALKAELEAIAKQAKTLQSRLKDGKPATADGRALPPHLPMRLPGGLTWTWTLPRQRAWVGATSPARWRSTNP